MARTTKTDSTKTPEGPQTITLPWRFSPRTYERAIFAAREAGCLRFFSAIHRRGGKSKTYMNLGIRDMARMPYCITVLHVCPSLVHGRRNVWDAKSSPREGGMPFRAHFPPGLIMESSETEMQITMKPMPHQTPQEIPDGHGKFKKVGSIYQIVGTENDEAIQKLRGINAYWWMFDEYQLQNPIIWTEIAMPVVMENGGCVAFMGTPAGKNHFYEAYRHALAMPFPTAGKYGYLCQLLTVDDTRRDAPGEDGSPVMGPAEVAEFRNDPLQTEETVQQELYCSWTGYSKGTIYGYWLNLARREGRIGVVTRNASEPVGACVDIGRTDGTAVWFYQVSGTTVSLIDYFACRGKAADYVFQAMQRKPYFYGKIILPREAESKPQGETHGESVAEMAQRLWPGLVHVNDSEAQKPTVLSGINAVRMFFSRFVFNEVTCDAEQEDRMPSGLMSLGEYRFGWNKDRQDFSGDPVHNAFSHGADALREGAKYGFPPLEFLRAYWDDELVTAASSWNTWDVAPQGREMARTR